MAAATAKAAALSTTAVVAMPSGRAHAQGGSGFRFPGFSSSQTPHPAAPPQPQSSPAPAAEVALRVWNDNPRTTAAGFDPEALEINKSPDAKKLFEIMKKQETRQVELAARKAEYQKELAAAEERKEEGTSAVLKLLRN